VKITREQIISIFDRHRDIRHEIARQLMFDALHRVAFEKMEEIKGEYATEFRLNLYAIPADQIYYVIEQEAMRIASIMCGKIERAK
jgi:hypothetical protein